MKRLLALIALLLAFVCPALAQDYPDGIYRGFYYDGGIEQIAIQFELKDGIFTSLIYRGVKYKDGDYMNEDASDAQKAILHQYRQLAEYLVGKDISAIDDLYSPYDIVEDLDAVTTATMKAGKLISALWDGLNRHPYKIVDTTKHPEARVVLRRRLPRQLHGGRRRTGCSGIYAQGQSLYRNQLPDPSI